MHERHTASGVVVNTKPNCDNKENKKETFSTKSSTNPCFLPERSNDNTM